MKLVRNHEGKLCMFRLGPLSVKWRAPWSTEGVVVCLQAEGYAYVEVFVRTRKKDRP